MANTMFVSRIYIRQQRLSLREGKMFIIIKAFVESKMIVTKSTQFKPIDKVEAA
jgi:hypothetical protein